MTPLSLMQSGYAVIFSLFTLELDDFLKRPVLFVHSNHSVDSPSSVFSPPRNSVCFDKPCASRTLQDPCCNLKAAIEGHGFV